MIAILIRDLRLAVRAGGGFGLGLAFFLIVVVLVPFGVGPNSQTLQVIAPGILWVGALLACLLSLDRIFALDFEDGSLDLLATAPVPLEGVVLMKALAHWITTGLPLVLASPVLGVLLNLEPLGYQWIIISLAFWGAVWGIPGMFLSVPIMVALMIICSEIPAMRPLAILLSREGLPEPELVPRPVLRDAAE